MRGCYCFDKREAEEIIGLIPTCYQILIRLVSCSSTSSKLCTYMHALTILQVYHVRMQEMNTTFYWFAVSFPAW